MDAAYRGFIDSALADAESLRDSGVGERAMFDHLFQSVMAASQAFAVSAVQVVKDFESVRAERGEVCDG
ncbi:hypothetical protein [uncultured Adlercreutzia sp.]|uniref:hypothetical protein n=1 Tax=uncultured Adlercreutzia sp. TaxID=875803 RepID=UPI0026F3A0D3|nr:hypothetical protein [uncultured Adlercreutzia sp.]